MPGLLHRLVGRPAPRLRARSAVPRSERGAPVIPEQPPVEALAPATATVLAPPSASSQDVIQQQTSAQDYVVLRFAVVGLLAAVVVSLVGVLLLAATNNQTPEGVLAIGSAAVGALSTMLDRPPLFTPGRSPLRAAVC